MSEILPGHFVAAWQPIETANISALFATSTWVLVATDTGRVTEAMPFYTDAEGYIWVVARGGNLRGNHPSSHYLRESATHWMPLPSPPATER